MRQLRDRLSNECHQAPSPPYQAPAPAASVANPAADGAVATTRPGRLSKAQEIYQQHLRDGTNLTGKRLGEMLGISDGYARRLLREITANQTPA